MAKVLLKATGGLNADMDANVLPEGDYIDANNIIFDAGLTGGAGAIKMIEAISTTGIALTGETIKATFLHTTGEIFVLSKDNAGAAYIRKIDAGLTTATPILNYTHSVSTDFTPDIKVIDNCIVWNYCKTGSVLLYSLDTFVSYGTIAVADLLLQKRTPNNVVTIVKDAINLTAGIEFLEANDFQFASRYQYKSGEFSVLSNYSQMYKGEKGVTGYTLIYSSSGRPIFAEKLEVYTRIGNNGTWRRIDTLTFATGVTTDTFNWKGQIYESLDSLTASKSFDAVPVSAKNIEIAKNRIFLANIVDDYAPETNSTLFTISAGNATELSTTSGTYNSYLTSSLVAETGANSINSSELSGNNYYKPLANNSTYAIGLAYYDEAMKTRGVEKYTKFTTGTFAYPILPSVGIALDSSWQKPSWATYAQVVYTKNTSKSYFYEGYASNIFFELLQISTNGTTGAITEETVLSQSVTKDQLKSVKSMVVDLMGMFRANSIYSYTSGDRISINTGTNGILNLKVTGQNGSLIYCEYTGAEMSNPTVPNSSVFYFEIYTPKQIQEDESLVFYEYGNLMNMSSWTAGTTVTVSPGGTLNTNKFIGDSVFQKLELPVYSASPFTKTTTKTSPAEVTLGVQTQANCQINSAYGSGFSIISTSSTAPSDVLNVPYFTSFTTGLNQDGANILDSSGAYASSGPELALSGYYDVATQLSSNFLTVEHKLLITKNIPFAISGSCEWAIYAKVMRVPYNNSTNTYGSPVAIIAEQQLYTETVTSTQTNVTYNLNYTQTVTLASYATDINANDKFYVTYRLTVPLMAGPSSLNINVKKQTAADNGIMFTVLGSRTAPKITTSYNPDAKVASTKTKYVVRSMSVATVNPFWNTSAGKPSLAITGSTITAAANRKGTIRHGGNYVAGTKVNNLSSFFALDSADVPIENGGIVSLQRASRLQGTGSMLLALCEKESAYVLLGEQELTNANNSTTLAITSNVIGTVRNLGYNYGLQEKLSVMNHKGNIWWWDNFNKKVIKYSESGIELVSDTFMRSYFLTKSGAARLCYDPFYNMCFIGIGSDTYSTGYSDTLKRWVAKYSFKSDFSESFGDKMVVFKDSTAYKSLQSGYASFFGTSASADITLTLNTRVPVMPLNVAISHDMNVMDYTNADNFIKTTLMDITITNENGQLSKIYESNFIAEDNRLYAFIQRDMNSSIRFDTIKQQSFTATSGQTVFTITGGYTAAGSVIDVYINSVRLPESSYVATNGTTVVLNTGATTGDTVLVVISVDKRLLEGDYIIGYSNDFVVSLKDKTQNMRINSLDIEVQPVSGHS